MHFSFSMWWLLNLNLSDSDVAAQSDHDRQPGQPVLGHRPANPLRLVHEHPLEDRRRRRHQHDAHAHRYRYVCISTRGTLLKAAHTHTSADALQHYQTATGAVFDDDTGLLRLELSQFASLQSLFFTINGVTVEFTANAQIWPVRAASHKSPTSFRRSWWYASPFPEGVEHGHRRRRRARLPHRRRHRQQLRFWPRLHQRNDLDRAVLRRVRCVHPETLARSAFADQRAPQTLQTRKSASRTRRSRMLRPTDHERFHLRAGLASTRCMDRCNAMQI